MLQPAATTDEKETKEADPPPFAPAPTKLEWFAFAAIALAMVALALVRCELTDTPYHLATARLAWETGSWPTTNTFSWTHPDYPLYQQYPVYQTVLYVVHVVAGWEGLSLFHLVSWSTIFVLWGLWGGNWKWTVAVPLAGVLLLLGLRERMVLRPDILTMIYFVGILHLVDHYRRGRWWTPLLFPAVILLWVNSHQMFWVGLLLQGALGAHWLVVRYLGGKWGIADDKEALPWWPIAAGFGLSLISCFLSPIGFRVLEVPAQTFGSLYFHKQNVAEFAPFYSSPQATWLVIVSLMLAGAGLALSRHRVIPFDVFAWLLGAAMVAGAIRGTAFFVALSVGLFVRGLRRHASAPVEETPAEGLKKKQEEEPATLPAAPGTPMALPRLAGVLVTLLLCGQIYLHRWIAPARLMDGSQFGVGRNLGAWPEEGITFIRKSPPPGPMMNLSWYIGNPLIYDLAGKHPVFVDPRFETFPRGFLVDAIAAETNDHAFDRLVDEYKPWWLVGELRVTGVRQQMARVFATGEWEFVHIDPVVAIMVRKTDDTEEYLREHRLDPAMAKPTLLLEEEVDLLTIQQLRLATFLADLGRPEAARRWLRPALENAAEYVVARQALVELREAHPDLFDEDLQARGTDRSTAAMRSTKSSDMPASSRAER